MGTVVAARFPPKLQCLFDPHRYKVLYGGRGGAKSWGVARALLTLGAGKPLKILCGREFQNSIDESVHALLSKQIEDMGLQEFYKIQKTEIVGINGTSFIFKGLKHNITSIKSFESVDIAWIEEAQTVSKSSWDILIPTIRKPGSEIWVTFNPMLATDETYVRFVLNPPPDSVVVKINYEDNPWFPDVLRREMEHLRLKDPDAFLNVWEGHCRVTLDGAVYARELREAAEQDRITKVPYDRSKPVHTFWDIGWSDSTAIWFAQAIGFEYHIIDYLEVQQRTVTEILQTLQLKGYVYGDDWLPHDARAKTLASGGRSIQQMLKEAGRSVRIAPSLSITDGINAARTIFPNCYFDEKNCTDGLNCLRHYRYEVDESSGQFSRKPLHDNTSHGADGFRMLAVSLKDKKKATIVDLQTKKTLNMPFQSAGWMG